MPVLVLVLLTLCCLTPSAEDYRAAGYITDYATGNPIASAHVMVLDTATRDTLVSGIYTDADGHYEVAFSVATGTAVEAVPDAGSTYRLGEAYPNPVLEAGTRVVIHYWTPGSPDEAPTLELFDVLGRSVNSMHELAQGLYYYRLRFGSGRVTEAKPLALQQRSRLQIALVHRAGAEEASTSPGGADKIAQPGAPASIEVLFVLEKQEYALLEAVRVLEFDADNTHDFALEVLDDGATAPNLEEVLEEIRVEATRSNQSPVGRPLPLASHWNTAEYSAEYAIALIEAGHHILPWGAFPQPNHTNPELWAEYLHRLAAWNLPFSLRENQLESDLYREPKYRDLPPDENPLVLRPDGTIWNRLSPFGAIQPWYDVGHEWTSAPMMAQLQQFYPDPPLVMILSNNEPADLRWHEAELSKRFLDQYGTGLSGNETRRVFGEGWTERYTRLFEGMRDGLTSDTWKENAFFVGYGAFGPPHLARWSGWRQYSLYTEEHTFPDYLYWDGGSPPFYTHSWNPSSDFRVWSPQIESMNWVFMLEEAYAYNPDFWFELSIWDGRPEKIDFYESLGQTWSPERYKGMIQYGMWLLTPRSVREFRSSTESLAETKAYFEALVEAVDDVYRSPTLERFWRTSTLIAHPEGQHPYQVFLPSRLIDVPRWFHLSTNLDPEAWGQRTPVPVFTLARVLGEPGHREWLVYAHSPLQVREAVEITVPEFGAITVDVSVGGSFYLLTEADHGVTPVDVRAGE